MFKSTESPSLSESGFYLGVGGCLHRVCVILASPPTRWALQVTAARCFTLPFFPDPLVLPKNEYIKPKRVHSGFSIINMFPFIYFSCVFLTLAVFLFSVSYSLVDTSIRPHHTPTPPPPDHGYKDVSAANAVPFCIRTHRCKHTGGPPHV